MLVVTLAWIAGQPTPGWLADPYETVGAPESLEDLVAFLPPVCRRQAGVATGHHTAGDDSTVERDSES